MASWRRSYPRVTFPSCSRHRRNLPVNFTRVFGNELLGETPSSTEKMFHVKHSYDENGGVREPLFCKRMFHVKHPRGTERRTSLDEVDACGRGKSV